MRGIPNTSAIETASTHGDHHGPPPEPLRVLVVDAEPLIRWSLAAALEEHGHHVSVAADRDAALHALETEPLDVILLDCHLADSADLDLLRVVRRRAPHTPVVGMTAFPSQELTRRVGTCGVARLLEKPFDVFGLERVLLDEYAKTAPCPAAKSFPPP
jgi:DNA-binding response OmpR family regulator